MQYPPARRIAFLSRWVYLLTQYFPNCPENTAIQFCASQSDQSKRSNEKLSKSNRKENLIKSDDNSSPLHLHGGQDIVYHAARRNASAFGAKRAPGAKKISPGRGRPAGLFWAGRLSFARILAVFDTFSGQKSAFLPGSAPDKAIIYPNCTGKSPADIIKPAKIPGKQQ